MKTVMDAVNEFKGVWNNDASNYLHLNSIEGRYLFSFKEYLRAFNGPFTLVCSREQFDALAFDMTVNFGESSTAQLYIWQEGIKRQPETDEEHADKLNEMDKELEVMEIDWSKAPEGATHYGIESSNYHGGFHKIISSDEGFFHDGTNYLKLLSWPELIEKPQPVFTQLMYQCDELPPIGSEAVLLVSKHSVASKDVDDRDGEVFDIVAHHGSAKGLAVAVSKDYMVSVTANHTWFKPIDTRTDKEKDIDKAVNNLMFFGDQTQTEERALDTLIAIKDGKIHGVKWVGE